jgi:indolepyruvate ferredoxin oxidoreductase
MDPPRERTLPELIEARAGELVDYQDAGLADRYRQRVAAIEAAEERVAPGRRALTEVVARQYARVLMVKDEYEVARLYTDGRFADRLGRTLEGGTRTRVHLAPPMLPLGRDGHGRPRKIAFGPWIFRLFALLAAMRRIRDTWADPMRFSADRRRERALVTDYEALLDEVATRLEADNLEAARRLLGSVEVVRGYGPVREANDRAWRNGLPDLLAAFRHPDPSGVEHRTPEAVNAA